jgi:flagellar protein FlgJ
MTPLATLPHKPEDVTGTVKKLTGVLWYNMLSELNKSGFDPDTLGTGGDDFQSMFLWNVAENDFGKYDSGLINAATAQLGGGAPAAGAAAAVPAFAPTQAAAMPPAALDYLTTAAGAIAASAAVAATAPPDTDQPAPAKSLVDQAKSFTQSVWPAITTAAAQLGVPATAMLAQAALETGWGAATPGHNIFGIKAAPGQPATMQPTHEMLDGILTPQTAAFRAYDSPADAIADYVSKIETSFSPAAGKSDIAGFARALQKSGYATDPHYADKIISIANSPLMTEILGGLGQPVKDQTP